MRKTQKQNKRYKQGGNILTKLKLRTMSRDTKIINLSHKKLTMLPDLRKFNNIIELSVNNNNITTINFLPHTLKILNCSNNQLDALPILPPNLSILICSNNPLHSLPRLPSNLLELECENCPQLTSLPGLPPKLTAIYCKNCPVLTFIPDTPPTLEVLDCTKCPMLTSLPVSILRKPHTFKYNRNIPFRNKHDEKIELIEFFDIHDKCMLNEDGEKNIVNHTTLEPFNETDTIYKVKDGHCYDWKTIKRSLTRDNQFKSHFTNEMTDLDTNYEQPTLDTDEIEIDFGGRNKTKKRRQMSKG
jgi:hypothetical protein